MGVTYSLVNYSKKEIVNFSHIPAAKARELAGNPISAAITTWYLLHNPGDHIAFVSDTENDWPFPKGARRKMDMYSEVTDKVVTSLIEAEILRDDGIAWADEDEPETIYIRDLRNIWVE